MTPDKPELPALTVAAQVDDTMSLEPAVRWKRVLQVVLDAVLSIAALGGAYLIRFDGAPSGLYLHQLLILTPIFLCLHLATNWCFGVYRRLWRYTGLTEVTELGLSIACAMTIVMIIRALNLASVDGNQLSYSIIFIEAGLAFLLFVGPRVLRRLETEHRQRRHWRQPVQKRALLVGAGDAGQMVARELTQRRNVGVDLVGFVDDDPQKAKLRIGNLTIFGSTNELPTLVEELFIDQVIIAMPSAPASEIRRIV
ncbi:MAG: hypothetical protein K2X29_15280, partial [Candidatus Obscuribacterales bacterium]|nr:hypothetical protein [Candidatus Obscuribacterales bacterium]